MTDLLRAERHGAVLRLTLVDEPTRNSLSMAMLQRLHAELQKADQDHSISIVVFAADGKVFSSGHNLKELSSHRHDMDSGSAFFRGIFELCSNVMESISNHRCVTIAEVNGLASAAGCQLVASCDLAYASPEAGFCTPGVNIGLFCSTPMVALSRTVSQKHAMEMLLTGDVYAAQQAVDIGLINAVVPHDQLSRHVHTVAEKIAAKSQTAISFGKRKLSQQLKKSLTEAYAEMSTIMVDNMLAESAVEGINAVLQKRMPKWP